ncbi:MAG: glycerate kinase type-2 family protein [Candidatus Levyibacteriota bacterium]
MPFIKNFESLAKSPQRKIVLELLEAAFQSIQPDHVMEHNFIVQDKSLTIGEKNFDLSSYDRVFLIGFGKGSAGISKIIEEKLGEKLTEGHVIDTNPETFEKIHFTQGTHPLPSTINAAFTQALLKRIATLQLTEKDLVLVVICGGGSAMLVAPRSMSLDQKIEVNKTLLKSGATISEMNMVRKHLSEVKGGGLAKALTPAIVASLIFSDVPGNDLSVIASSPTHLDPTTVEDAKQVIAKYHLETELSSAINALQETPKEENIFKNVSNIIITSNKTALEAMQKKAEELGVTARIISDRFEHEAKSAGEELIKQTQPNSILLAGGETTVHVTGGGAGGRNQEVVMGSLLDIDDNTIISSFDSDGWDNSKFAGAIGDSLTKKAAGESSVDIREFLANNNSLGFFEKTGDGIDTGRLPSNVSDLFVVYKF